MTYSPTTIAREAALNCAWALDIFVPHENNDAPELQACTKIILTAAARMVAESGAREALEAGTYICRYTPQMDGNKLSGINASEAMRFDKLCRPALANLAKLEGRG